MSSGKKAKRLRAGQVHYLLKSFVSLLSKQLFKKMVQSFWFCLYLFLATLLSELNLCMIANLISSVSSPLQQTRLIRVSINFVSSQLALSLSPCIPFDECVN